uniref:TusE/DsrC/DsvC family sulfur relay protein n=1 Tax=Cellvibrio fontiphilus TaxID=1815559 RepID=UPI002B4BB760|nr:TusE/DsrC/DsvC family sulfur relay protein [Cellvibrio fontiphilus]
MYLNIDNQKVPVDKDGFLVNLQDWTPNIAEKLAQEEEIELTPEHWKIILLLREFYAEFQISPAMRALVKYIEKKLGPEKGRSVYLLNLFPPSPAKIASKIAGLPRPTNCL